MAPLSQNLATHCNLLTYIRLGTLFGRKAKVKTSNLETKVYKDVAAGQEFETVDSLIPKRRKKPSLKKKLTNTRTKKSPAPATDKKSKAGISKRVSRKTSKDFILLILGGLIGTIFNLILPSTSPVIIIPLIPLIVLAWVYVIVPLLRRAFTKRMYKILSPTLLILMLVVVIGAYVQKTPYFFGAQNLRGIIGGISVPSSDFTWATNGSVLVTPVRKTGDTAVMKVEFTLRGDKTGDAGWGMDLLQWDWLKFTTTYDSSLWSKEGVSFFIRGEKGGEKIGISMKSDRDISSPSNTASDEEAIPLSSLNVNITTDWQKVHVPFAKLYNFDKRRARNVAFYTDSDMMKGVGESEIIYLKNITFWNELEK